MYEANSQDEWGVMHAAEQRVVEHADVIAQELDGLALLPLAGDDATEEWKARCIAAMASDGEEFVEKPYRPLDQIMDQLLADKPILQDMRHKCVTYGGESKCHICEEIENGTINYQLQGVAWEEMAHNIPTVTDSPFAVCRAHHNVAHIKMVFQAHLELLLCNSVRRACA